jgi:hypothetical protein
MGEDLVLLAGRTALNILGDPMVHPWLKEAVSGLSDRFILAWVPHCGVVMDQGHQVTFLCFRGLPNCYGLYKFLWWQHSYISVVFFPLVGVEGSEEDVGSCVGLSRYVMDSEVIFLQVCMPSGSPLVKVFQGLPILEVYMVHEDDKGEFGPPQVVSPMGQRFYHS